MKSPCASANHKNAARQASYAHSRTGFDEHMVCRTKCTHNTLPSCAACSKRAGCFQRLEARLGSRTSEGEPPLQLGVLTPRPAGVSVLLRPLILQRPVLLFLHLPMFLAENMIVPLRLTPQPLVAKGAAHRIIRVLRIFQLEGRKRCPLQRRLLGHGLHGATNVERHLREKA
jgi:hypothetical protein